MVLAVTSKLFLAVYSENPRIVKLVTVMNLHTPYILDYLILLSAIG